MNYVEDYIYPSSLESCACFTDNCNRLPPLNDDDDDDDDEASRPLRSGVCLGNVLPLTGRCQMRDLTGIWTKDSK